MSNLIENNSNIKKIEKVQIVQNDINSEMFIFLLNQAASIEQLLKNY